MTTEKEDEQLAKDYIIKEYEKIIKEQEASIKTLKAEAGKEWRKGYNFAKHEDFEEWKNISDSIKTLKKVATYPLSIINEGGKR